MAAAGMPAGGKLSFRITLISSRASASCTVQFRIPRSGSITPHRRAFTMTRYRLQQRSYVNILILLLLIVSPSWTFAQPPAGCNVPNVCVDFSGCQSSGPFLLQICCRCSARVVGANGTIRWPFRRIRQQGARIISMREPEEPRPGHPQTRRRRLGCRRQAAGEFTASKGRDPAAAFRDCRSRQCRESGCPAGSGPQALGASERAHRQRRPGRHLPVPMLKVDDDGGRRGRCQPPQSGSRYDPIT